MLVNASGFNWGSFAVPQIRGDVVVGELGLRATLALGAESTTRELVAGPGITEFLRTCATAGLAASERASAGDIFATTAFIKLNEEMCVAPLARSDFTIGACSDRTADSLATERAASAPFWLRRITIIVRDGPELCEAAPVAATFTRNVPQLTTSARAAVPTRRE
jgi:hypothetical protein